MQRFLPPVQLLRGVGREDLAPGSLWRRVDDGQAPKLLLAPRLLFHHSDAGVLQEPFKRTP